MSVCLAEFCRGHGKVGEGSGELGLRSEKWGGEYKMG